MPTATELNINTTVDATDLANEIFGSGINVTSATIAGDAVQYGIYSGGETTSGGVVPSDGGVILSTGNVTDFTNSDGTVNTNTTAGTSTGTTNGVDGDAQLDAIAGVATFDGVILEATFVPTGDFITMQFVFSSEEYLEYVNGGVNDAVGVWVNGTFAPLTPSGDTVSIDTVNDASNQNLYVDNPEATDPYNTEMDGFTVTMSLKAPVNSGQPNTIKIGLADGGDDAFDSNLLIAGDSIQTFALAMSDEVTLLPNDSRVVDVLANDVDQTGGGLTITEINGQAVSAGDTVILATGESVTLNADGTLTVQSDGDVTPTSLTYSVIDSAGNTDVGYLTINTTNTVSPDGTVEGSAGDDVINAGYLGDPNGDFVDANDGLGAQGTVGNDDLIYAYDGNDDVQSGEGNDIVFAGAGDDSVFAGNNDDIVYGGDGTDSLAGQSGNDELYGGANDDILSGDADTDSIYGGADNDSLLGGEGADTLDGGTGDDTLLGDATLLNVGDYASTTSGAATTLTVVNNADGPIELWWIDDTGTLQQYATIQPGGSFVQPTFSDHNWVLQDEDGNLLKLIEGAENQTVVYGDESLNDNLSGGDGNDTIDGQFGDDYIDAGAGDDIVYGGSGNDSSFGGDDNDEMYGGTGNDALNGGSGDDTLYGGDGDDLLFATSGNDTVFGGAGNDEIGASIGSDEKYGGAGDDTITAGGTAGAGDTMDGGTGNDTLIGGLGDDTSTGGDGDDVFQVGNSMGTDTVTGGEGAETVGDTLDATAMTDNATLDLSAVDPADPESGTLSGAGGTTTFSEIEMVVLGSGDDSVIGSTGDDSVVTGSGDDVVDLGAGNDTLDLGDGGGPDGDGDTIVLENGDGDDVIFNFDAPLPNGSGGFTGTDVFDVSGMTDAGGDPVDTNDVTVGDDGSGNAVLSFPNGESVTLIGVDPVTADDPFWLNAAGIPLPNGTVEGTAGDDLIDDTYTGDPDGDMVDAGDAVLSGDTGNDDLIYGYGGNDSINAGDANDEVYGGDDADAISGGAGDDTLFGDAGDDLIEAGTGNDTVFGGTGTDQITITEDDGTDIAAGGESAGDDDSIVFFEDGATGIDVSMTGNEAGDYLFVSGNGDGSFTEIETVNMTNQDDTYDGTATTSGMGVVAGDGDDSLIGGSGSDTLQGDAGADTIAGNGGDDIVSAGTGDDLIQIGDNHGNDTVYGGEDVGDGDTDTLDLYENGSGQGVTVEFTGDEAGTYDFDGTASSGSFQQMEVIDGTQSDDTLDAGADTGGVTLFGNAGTDTITGGQGNDQLSGGADDDTFLVEDNFGSDTIIGGQTGTNYDTIDLSALTNPVTVSFTGPGAGSITDQITGDTIVFSQVEQLILTDQADVVDATNDNGYTYIQTLEGDDSVLGSAGDDVIDEEIGVGPTLDGEGNDTFFGEAGNDEIWAGNDDDLVYGGTGNDTLNGQAGNDTVFGGDGNDEVNGGGGDDVLLGDAGDDTLSGDGGDDIFDLTGGGNDTVIGGEIGETQGDVLSTGSYTGNSTVDLTAGGTGADPESGTITTTEGTTTFSEIEIVSTGVGDDSVIGSSGDDKVATGEGADTVDAGAGNDEIDLGGSFVSVGNDVVYEGDGDADTIILQDGDGQDEINGFDAPTDNGDGTYTGIDQIDVSGLTDALGNPVYTSDVTVTDDGAGNAVLTFPNGEQLTLFGVDPVYVDDPFVLNAMGIPIADGTVSGTAGNDTIDAGYTGDPDGDLVDANDALLPGDTGNDDVIDAGAGDDSILAGDGNDEISGGTGNDTIDGGTGDDLVYSGADADVVYGGEGNDSIFTQEGDDIAYGGAGNDYFETWIGNDTVYGGGGDDTIDGAEGNDTLYGDAGNDFLMGGNNGGEDELYGGDGDDTLWSGDGDDIVEGGTGNDNIDASGGDDTILLTSGFGDDDITAGETGESTGDTLDAQGVTEDVTLDLSALFAGNPESGTISDGTSTASFIEVENIDLGGGDDTVIGSSGDDSVNAGLGADTLDGGAGNDTFDLGGFDFFGPDAAQDTVVLQDGSGDDTLLNFEAPIDNGDGTYTPGDVFDVTALTDAGGNPVHTTDVTVGDDGSGNAVLSFPNGESVTLIGVAPEDVDDPFALNAMGIPLPDGTIDGTAGNDVIDTGYTGDPDGDVVDGNDAILPGDSGNDDVIDAGAGNDTILAGDGDDYVEADEGDDTVYGGDGNDSIFGFEGSDTVEGGDGDDYINTRTSPGTGLPDEAYPGGGFPDDPDPTNDMDSVSGGAGNDEILTGDDNDIVYGGTGEDSIDAGLDDDLVFGGTGDDFISGNEGADTLSGEDGDDTIYGDDATGTYSSLDIPDNIDLQPDNQIDTIYGGAGNDTIFGMDDADVLYGGTGNDVIDGGIDDDSLFGGEGADSLSGGDGADTITFAEGDTAEGGTGDDLFILEDLGEPTNGTITIDGGSEDSADTLQLGSLGGLTQAVQDSFVDDGTGSFSGTITLDDGTILNFSEIENIICFTPGTRIATPRGQRPIEELKVGDLVVTRDHGLQPIRWIQSRTVPAIDRFAPVRIRPGVVTGLETDLLVSPQHRMLFQGYQAELLFGDSEVLVAATHLVDGLDVTTETGGTVTYIHMMFDQHEIIYAEGAASESFHPGEIGLSAVSDPAREELFALFPELRSDPRQYGQTARKCLKKHEAQLIRF